MCIYIYLRLSLPLFMHIYILHYLLLFYPCFLFLSLSPSFVPRILSLSCCHDNPKNILSSLRLFFCSFFLSLSLSPFSLYISSFFFLSFLSLSFSYFYLILFSYISQLPLSLCSHDNRNPYFSVSIMSLKC